MSQDGPDPEHTLKAYPLEVGAFLPYLGVTNRFSFDGYFKESRTFGEVEFNFSDGGMPLSVLGGADFVSSESEELLASAGTLELSINFRFNYRASLKHDQLDGVR